MTTGRVYLGGLDDQLGRSTWAQKDMSSALAAYLPGDQEARCLGILQRHILWQYTDAARYGFEDKARILGCLDSIDTKLRETGAPARDNDVAMMTALRNHSIWTSRTCRQGWMPKPCGSTSGTDRCT